MTERELEIIAHSLGFRLELDDCLPKKFFRNHYSASESATEFKTLVSMYKKGWLWKREVFGNPCFHVTKEGIQLFRDIIKSKGFKVEE